MAAPERVPPPAAAAAVWEAVGMEVVSEAFQAPGCEADVLVPLLGSSDGAAADACAGSWDAAAPAPSAAPWLSSPAPAAAVSPLPDAEGGSAAADDANGVPVKRLRTPSSWCCCCSGVPVDPSAAAAPPSVAYGEPDEERLVNPGCCCPCCCCWVVLRVCCPRNLFVSHEVLLGLTLVGVVTVLVTGVTGVPGCSLPGW